MILFPDIPLHGVKGVLLDLDNTLYAYDEVHHVAMQACTEKFIQEYPFTTPEFFQELYNKARKRVNHELHGQGASHSRLLYFQKLFENFLGYTHFEKTLQYEALYWNTFLQTMKILPKALSFLQECYQKKIPICLVTDLTAQIQHKKIIQLNIQPYIKFMVSSEEAGVEKPHPYPFLLALEKMNLAPCDVIMIGDSEKKDKLGADLCRIQFYQVQHYDKQSHH
ncbi:MAG: HAD family hydrolase [Cytophagales bacterium]|nr:HAD family hydrolase [Cytophagales bacterium]MDW8385191.1 HAD family hydrolase [Flammeovirgaceae bacterium]